MAGLSSRTNSPSRELEYTATAARKVTAYTRAILAPDGGDVAGVTGLVLALAEVARRGDGKRVRGCDPHPVKRSAANDTKEASAGRWAAEHGRRTFAIGGRVPPPFLAVHRRQVPGGALFPHRGH